MEKYNDSSHFYPFLILPALIISKDTEGLREFGCESAIKSD